MKYIITWFLVTTFENNHSNTLVSIMKTIREAKKIESNDRDYILKEYWIKVKEYNSQFKDSLHTFILCPKCFEYIDSVKIDSVEIKNVQPN